MQMLKAAFTVTAAAALIFGATATASADVSVKASEPGHYLYDGAAIRTDSNTNARILGRGYLPHRVEIYCYRKTSDWAWVYHKNLTTGVTGWTHRSLIQGDGVPHAGYC